MISSTQNYGILFPKAKEENQEKQVICQESTCFWARQVFLQAIHRHEYEFREGFMGLKKLHRATRHIFICEGKDCTRDGADKTARHIRQELRRLDLDDEALDSRMSCAGLCGKGPVVVVYPDGTWYGEVTAKAGEKIVREHLADGRPPEKYLLASLGDGREE